MGNVYNYIINTFDNSPEKIAISFVGDDFDQCLTYAQFKQMIELGKERLQKMGIKPGCQVGLLSENRLEWYPACFSILGADCTAVLFDQMQTLDGLKELFSLSDISCLFVSKSTLLRFKDVIPPRIRIVLIDDFFNPFYDLQEKKHNPPHDADPEVAFIVFTSGTGGAQHGVMLTHDNVIHNINFSKEYLGASSEDIVLCPLPLNHMYAWVGCILFLVISGTVVLINKVSGELIVKTLRSKNMTGMLFVPRLFEAVHKAIFEKVRQKGKVAEFIFNSFLSLSWFFQNTLNLDISPILFRSVQKNFGGKLRFVTSGGAPVPDIFIRDFRSMGFPCVPGYGLTENSPSLSVENLYGHRLGSVGFIDPKSKVKIVNKNYLDEGEICIKGPSVMKGYYRNPEATQKVLIDGWLHTGDIGKIDKDGFLFITGRIKDLIVTSSGNKVAPDTIEVKLLGTPELKEYAVVGMTMKEDLGEQIVLAAVPNNDVKLPTETDDDFLRRVATIIEQKTAELPSYAHISYIYFVDTLPKTTTLKVKRRDLKQILKTLKPFVTSDKEHSTFFDEDEEYQSINTQVIDLIQQHKNKEYINITPRSSLQFDLNVDSLDRVALKDILENHFNCHISDDRMFKAERVEDLAHLVIMDSEYDKINEVEVKERSSKISKILARGWLYLLKKLWKIEVIGKENIPKTGSFILAANHTSHLDAYWVLSILEPEQRRNTFTFAKKEHFESSSTRLLVEMINSIPIDRTGNFTFALNEGLDKLKIGCNLLIFPEGTRSKDGSLGTLRLGTAHLALRSLVPIIPIYISGGSDIYSTHDSFPRLFDFKNMGRRKVTIVIGKPIQPILKPNLKENAECITKTLESEIIKNARLVA